MSEHERNRRERGAVLVLATLLLTGLMVMAAIVVDLGHKRGMRSSNQTVADFAALAAGEALSHPDGPDAPTACVDAERYLRLNADGLADIDLDCGSLPTVCMEDTAWTVATEPTTVTDSTDAYVVSVTFPVADSMIDDSTVGGGARLDDGVPCERMMVEVEQQSSTYFAGVVGKDELTVEARAVVRQIPERVDQVPSLWLLDPYGCDVLTVQGGAQVQAGTDTFGGLISLDSDGTGSDCESGTRYTVDVGGSGSVLHAVHPHTDPPGRISLHAMVPGQQQCDDGNPKACDQGDVNDGTLQPQPERRALRATRAPVDHRFNCRTGEDAYPDYHGIPIEDCEGDSGNYIDQLRSEVGTTGAPGGWNTWSSADGCNVASGDHSLEGNWFVDCADFRIGNNTHVDFTGGNVIFAGDITMTGGTLDFNSANPVNLAEACHEQVAGCLDESGSDAAWVYMREGDLVMTGGQLIAHHTAIYQHDGHFRIAGGSPPIWSAPVEGPFTSLSVWSEKATGDFRINGGASMELTGIFFTPEADAFTLSGGAPVVPQEAQFISHRAEFAGGADLILAPLEIEPVVTPPPEALLIR
ncbi:MAG: hypothetical protein ACLFRV_12110 [Acidimicrobiales bacterium]